MKNKKLLLWAAFLAAAALVAYISHDTAKPLDADAATQPVSPRIEKPVEAAKEEMARQLAPGRIQMRIPNVAAPGANAGILVSLQTTTDMPRSPLADALGREGFPAQREAWVVLDLLEYYRQSFGGMPAGEDNRQIVNALRGANPQQLAIIPPDHLRLSTNGELMDAWGTPFYFHQISSQEMDVRSAGEDGDFYTADDLLAQQKQ